MMGLLLGRLKESGKRKLFGELFFSFLSSPFGELSFSPFLNLNLGGETAEFARRFSRIGLKMHAHKWLRWQHPPSPSFSPLRLR